MAAYTPVMFTRWDAGRSIARLVENEVVLSDEAGNIFDASNPLPVTVVPGIGAVAQVARASAPLPGAGAFDPAPVELVVETVSFATLYVSYDENAATTTGAMDFRVEFSPYTATETPSGAEWFQGAAFIGGVVTPGVDTPSRLQREIVGYEPTGITVESYVYGPVEIRGTVKRMRVAARESGDTTNPGTVEILVVTA